jgi:hypothetical protein
MLKDGTIDLLVAKEEICEDDDLEVQIVLGRDDNTSCGKCEAYYIGREGPKYVFQAVLGQYESPGKYYVAHVYLTDDAGNKIVYATKESPSKLTISFTFILTSVFILVTKISKNSGNIVSSKSNITSENSCLSPLRPIIDILQ